MTQAKKLNAKRRSRAAILVAIAALFTALLHASAAEAAPTRLWQECENGTGSGQCLFPRGIAADPTTGHVYVADQNNHRVVEFTAWGAFIRAWGWGVLDGKSEFQNCTSSTGCLSGLQGSGAGQFGNLGPQGIAVDSTGDVYVVDFANDRVEKFDPSAGPPGEEDAELLFAFGSTGTASGQFSWSGGVGAFIDVGPGNTVYVGDLERVQGFDTSGNVLKSFPLPGESVQSLAVDPAGMLYLAFTSSLQDSKTNVVKLDPTKPNPIAEPVCTVKVKNPRALATDAAGNLYAVDGRETLSAKLAIRKFQPDCVEVPGFTFSDDIGVSTGIATNTVTEAGGVGLYVSAINEGGVEAENSYFVRAYAPPPDKPLPFDQPPLLPPTISAQYAVSADATGATLAAQINPHFWPDTTYYVQYGTGKCSEEGCDKEQPLAPGLRLTTARSGSPLTTAGVFLVGLQPGITYHYRFVAKSTGGGPAYGVDPDGDGPEEASPEKGEEASFHTFALPGEVNESCPNQAFRTGPSAALPDCRAYEMVSPVDKNNGDIAVSGSLFFGPAGWRSQTNSLSRIDQSAAGGDAITYSAQRSFGDALSSGWSTQYIASRNLGSGWSTHSISPPRRGYSLYFDLGQELQFKGFSEDLCSAWVLDDSGLALTPGAPVGVPGLYRRRNCGEEGYELLTPEAPPGYKIEPVPPGSSYILYPQGFSADGSRTVFLANAKLTPKACETNGIFQIYESVGEGNLRLISALPSGSSTCTNASVGIAMGGVTDFRKDNLRHAVSDDGTRVYWTDTHKTGALNYDGPGEIYLRINADQPQSAVSAGKCTQPTRACTIAVSGTGSRFWAADPSGATAIYQSGEELFEFDANAKSSSLIAEGVDGLLGTSEDLSHIYFTSTKVLDETPNAEGEKAQPGQPNLYLDERGHGLAFVATLAKEDIASASNDVFLAPDNIRPSYRTARVSPDGQHLAFVSQGQPTGYDNSDAKSGQPDAEVYLYEAGSEQLRCVSCNPSGARPTGRKTGSELGRTFWTAAVIPGWETGLQPSRVLSDDGTRLFFESYEPLVLADTNGAQDVYEWEEAGSGDCTEESSAFSQAAAGCVSLISSGENPTDSEFIDAAADGRDVFFTTNASLLPQDPGLVDIYDARAGGGFPPAPKPAPACEGEACQGPPAPPNDPTPGSSSFEGAGNVVEGPAKKKKAHKKKAKKHKRQANHKRRSAR